jgi:hypothetical protein
LDIGKRLREGDKAFESAKPLLIIHVGVTCMFCLFKLHHNSPDEKHCPTQNPEDPSILPFSINPILGSPKTPNAID